MGKFDGKKLLVLGGKPIGSCEVVEYAKKEGAYVVVADYLPAELSAAKRLADQAIDISTANVDELAKFVQENHIDGVYTGVHEFNIGKMLELCKMCGIPCYCTPKQWDKVDNKASFKNMCRKYGIPVAREYHLSSGLTEEELRRIEYPVIVKPVDGSGSRGFSICENPAELRNAYPKAAGFSRTGTVLVEQYMDYRNSAIVNYTLIDGNVYYSGIGDKTSKKVTDSGAPIMSSVIYPSVFEREYLENLNAKVERMFREEGYKNGAIWIEAFCDNGKFTFNEMGYRFGGSLTYHPVRHRTGMDQLALQVEYALTGKNEITQPEAYSVPDDIYMVLPVHVRPGKIARIEGIDELKQKQELNEIVFVHHVGDQIENWGSAQQVFAYVHFITPNREQAKAFAKFVVDTIKVYDENGNQMLFNLYID